MIFIGNLEVKENTAFDVLHELRETMDGRRSRRLIEEMSYPSQTAKGILSRHYESFDQILSRLPLLRGARYVSNMVMTR
jgi:hypothetical protein